MNFKFWRLAPSLRSRYGPDDDEDLVKKMTNLDFSDPDQRAEELSHYPLSHNARIHRISFLLMSGRIDEAKKAVMVGVAIYPESMILVNRFLDLFRDDLKESEKEAILGRVKPLTGFESFGI